MPNYDCCNCQRAILLCNMLHASMKCEDFRCLVDVKFRSENERTFYGMLEDIPLNLNSISEDSSLHRKLALFSIT